MVAAHMEDIFTEVQDDDILLGNVIHGCAGVRILSGSINKCV